MNNSGRGARCTCARLAAGGLWEGTQIFPEVHGEPEWAAGSKCCLKLEVVGPLISDLSFLTFRFLTLRSALVVCPRTETVSE
jgi:hypothetical protein